MSVLANQIEAAEKAEKAPPDDFLARFREIVSDPLNVLIERHRLAGYVNDEGMIVLHNGNLVPAEGEHAYCGNFSYILIINRGVHEPLEEYVFQELLKVIPEAPTMLELGAYWGHYSMWLKRRRHLAKVYLVEPHEGNLQVGRSNFALNNLEGEFLSAFVGAGEFEVDTFLETERIARLNILHADIQGREVEMLKDCARSLQARAIDYLFVSTHSQELHDQVLNLLRQSGYRIEVSADFENDTTAYDGFVFASSPGKPSVFSGFCPMGRSDIVQATPAQIVARLTAIQNGMDLRSQLIGSDVNG